MSDTEKTYPYEEGENIVLGPGIFATKDRKVLNWDGVNYVPQAAVNLHPELKAYKVGEIVEALKAGDWLTGHITSIGFDGSPIYVHTERGPVTVASTRMIRKLA